MRDVAGREEEEETKVYVPAYSEWRVEEERDRAVNSTTYRPMTMTYRPMTFNHYLLTIANYSILINDETIFKMSTAYDSIL